MAPRTQNQLQPSFDPSRDIDAYMSDKGKALRQRGLQKQSIRLYELLCRLCPPGEPQLVYDQQADLVSDLKRLAPGESGLTEGSVSRKLNRLASLGFAAKSGGGQSNCPLVVDLYLPDLVAPKPPRPRKPAVVVSPSDERQGQFFDGGAAFRLVGADDEPPKAQSLAVSKAQPLALSVGESAIACAFEPSRQEEPTSSPRTRVRAPAVDDEVDDDDEVESIEGFCFEETNGSVAGRRTLSQSKLLPSPEKFGSAVDGVARDLRRLRTQRIRIPEPERRDVEAGVPHYENLSLLLRARLTVMAGRLDEEWYLHGIEYVLEFASGRRVDNCFKLLTKDWARTSDAMCALSPSRMGLPPDWYDLAAPKILPFDMLPERLQKRRARQDTESRKSGKDVDLAEIDRLHRKSAKRRAELEEARLVKKRPEGSPNGEEPQRE